MFFAIISSDLVGSRIDADFYQPKYLKALSLLRRNKTKKLESLTNYVRKGIFDMPANLYAEHGIPFLRISDMEGISVNLESAIKIPKWKHDEEYKTRLCGGDLVLSKVGTTGQVAKIPDGADINISQNLVGISVNRASVDSDYLLAVLNSPTMFLCIDRHVTTAVQGKLTLDILRTLDVPFFESIAQKYIGDKVRQAERLRAWAKELRSSVDAKLDQLSLPTSEVPAMVNRVSTERLEARLDPRPYRTHYINLADRIAAIKHSCVSDVAELASGCPVSSNDFIEGGEVPLVRIRNIGFDEFIDLDTGVAKELHKDEAKYQAKENMIVLGMDGIFRAQFCLSNELPMLVNQRVGMLTTNDIRAELLTHWLNRPEGQMQLNQWAVKTTVEHTSLSDIGRVRIPRLETDVEDDLADNLRSARRAYRYSRFLTICAKHLVEALIEGQLTEAELIAAEQALQAGNDQLDRRILNRLKTDGIDGQGPALFGDLDELFHLLTDSHLKRDSTALRQAPGYFQSKPKRS